MNLVYPHLIVAALLISNSHQQQDVSGTQICTDSDCSTQCSGTDCSYCIGQDCCQSVQCNECTNSCRSQCEDSTQCVRECFNGCQNRDCGSCQRSGCTGCATRSCYRRCAVRDDCNSYSSQQGGGCGRINVRGANAQAASGKTGVNITTLVNLNNVINNINRISNPVFVNNTNINNMRLKIDQKSLLEQYRNETEIVERRTETPAPVIPTPTPRIIYVNRPQPYPVPLPQPSPCGGGCGAQPCGSCQQPPVPPCAVPNCWNQQQGGNGPWIQQQQYGNGAWFQQNQPNLWNSQQITNQQPPQINWNQFQSNVNPTVQQPFADGQVNEQLVTPRTMSCQTTDEGKIVCS